MKNKFFIISALAAVIAVLASCNENADPLIEEAPILAKIEKETSLWVSDTLFNYMADCSAGIDIPEGFSAECGFRLDSEASFAGTSGESRLYCASTVTGPYEGDHNFSVKMFLGQTDSDGQLILDPALQSIYITPYVTITDNGGKKVVTVWGNPLWAEPSLYVMIFPS